MKTEAKKTFKSGFLLTEQELRRLANLVKQQLEKASGGQPSVSKFEVKFRNGAIAEPSSLDEILAQENAGSASIVRLKITLQDRQEDPAYQVSTEFVNVVAEEEAGSKSMRYTVVGDDRDWVFVTSSELEERIGRIKRVNLTRLLSLSDGPFSVLVMMLVLVFMMFTLFGRLSIGQSEIPAYIEQAEQAWRSGEITDPIELILALERGSRETQAIEWSDWKYLVYVLGGIVVIGLLAWGAQYFFPSYNFCWGDYVREFERRRKRGTFIYVTVLLLTIVLPLVVQFLSSALGF